MKNFIIDSKREIGEIVLIIAVALIPFRLNLYNILLQPHFSFGALETDVMPKYGNLAVSVIAVAAVTYFIWKSNAETTFNQSGNNYHNKPYGWYRFCASCLHYRKCDLIRVPIAMQFRLINDDVFKEYSFGSDSTYRTINNEKIDVMIVGELTDNTLMVNIILSDTYNITDDLIPQSLKRYPMILFSRRQGGDGVQTISKSYTTKIQEAVHKLPSSVKTINLFPATNAQHNYTIANNIFKKGGRSAIKHLYVYPQPNGKNGDWRFAEAGVQIY